MQNTSDITEALALGTLLKMSETAAKSFDLPTRVKNGVLNAINRFGSDFLSEEDFKPKSYGSDTVTPYEMAYRIVSQTDNADLKALWYIFYPYLVVASPHIDEALYEKTKAILFDREVLETVLSSRYRELVYDCEEDLQAAGLAGVYVEWYEPYAEYRKETISTGDTREIQTFKKLLTAGEFDAVEKGTGRLLNYDPYNVDVALLNIAAKVALLPGSVEKKTAALNETVEFIDEYIGGCENPKQLAYIHYYRGLCLLGLAASGGDIEGAKAEFQTCLDITPNFERAALMLKAIDEKLSDNG